MEKISCSILTPECHVYEGEVDFAVVQAYDGEMGFLVNHLPLISELGIGEIRLSNENETEYFVAEGGIVELRDNRLTILAEKVFKKDELYKKEIESQLKELRERKIGTYSEERMEIEAEGKRLKARLKVANR